MLSIGRGAFNNKPTKTIWLTNTPPSGLAQAAGTINYVANNSYTSLSNITVYPFLSSIFEVNGIRYVPVSPSERTCDAIDCAYNNTAQNVHIDNTVFYMEVELFVSQLKPYVCYGNKFVKDVNLDFEGSVGDYAFSGCEKLETATLGSQVTAINESAFSGCSSLKEFTVPDAVTSIGSEAFSGCTSLTDMLIGKKVNTMDLQIILYQSLAL